MIKGKKIGLRAVERKDLALLRDWRNIAEFRRNFREFRELNMALQERWYEAITNSLNDFMFVIVRLRDNKLIGTCGLIYINWIIRSSDISFYIGLEKTYIDTKGYADEALKLLMKYAFGELNMNKIWTELYEFDVKKIKFFEKYNFKKDALLRDNCYKEGRYWNSYIYSILKKDYSKL